MFIPERKQGALIDLATWDDGKVQDLFRLVGKNPVVLQSAEQVRVLLSKNKIASPDKNFAVLDALLPLLFEQAESSRAPDEVAEDVVRTVATSPKGAQLAPAALKNLKARVASFLQLPRLSQLAQAAYLQVQHQRTFESAQIITDLRPSVTPTGIGGIVGLIHMLKLTIIENSEEQELFIALDRDDLRKLDGAVRAAIKTEKSVLELVSKSGLEVLDEGLK